MDLVVIILCCCCCCDLQLFVIGEIAIRPTTDVLTPIIRTICTQQADGLFALQSRFRRRRMQESHGTTSSWIARPGKYRHRRRWCRKRRRAWSGSKGSIEMHRRKKPKRRSHDLSWMAYLTDILLQPHTFTVVSVFTRGQSGSCWIKSHKNNDVMHRFLDYDAKRPTKFTLHLIKGEENNLRRVWKRARGCTQHCYNTHSSFLS